MAIDPNLYSNFQTLEYQKYVNIVNDTNFPPVSVIKTDPSGNTFTAIYPKSAILTYQINAGGGGSGGASGDVTAAGVNGGVAQAVQGILGGVPLPISATSLPLMTGAALSSLQVTGNASLTAIAANTAALAANVPGIGQKLMASSQPVVIASDQTPLTITNTPNLMVEGFNNLDPSAWNTVAQASGDLLLSEGNTLNSSYLAMSLDPTTENTETFIESVSTFSVPVRVSIAASASQRQLGQEMSFEWVSTETATGTITSVAVATLSQTTTTITVNTASSHGLKPGDRVSIGGCADSRANFSCLVVATAPTLTQFTSTHTGSATITSQTITSQSTGTVYFRNAMKFAPNGTSMNFDTVSPTEATFFSRSSGIGSFVSGTPLNTQRITVNTTATATNPLANLTGIYSYSPTSIYELVHQPDHYEWMDKAIDSATAGYTVRFRKDQVVPDPTKRYKLRARIRNNGGVTRVTSKIISAAKAGTTTSTITHDGSVTYTTGDLITMFGRRDFTTNFPNVTTAVAIASIINSTSFTVVDGAATPTATTYGGAVVRVNGTVTQTGIATMSIQSAIRGADGYLILTGSATWSGVAVGDLVNVYGARVDLTGADLGIDGAYRVRDLLTTALTLESVGSTGTGTFGSTNCGGCVIKRTDLRISTVRIAPYTRALVESTGGISKLDQASAAPVFITGGNNVTITSLPTLAAVTTVATVTSLSQIAGNVPLTSVANGSTNRALGVSVATVMANTDHSAVAFAGAGRVNGAVVASATGGGVSCSFHIAATVTTLGTATALLPVLQESYDSGTTWSDIWTGHPFTTTQQIRVPAIPISGRRRWTLHNVGGTSTTVPMTITAQELAGQALIQRQYVDVFAATNPMQSVINGVTTSSTLVSTTLNSGSTSASGIAIVEGCKNITISGVFTGGTPTTAPTYALQLSQDATNWFTTATTFSPSAAGTFMATFTNASHRFARIVTTVASAGGTPYGVTYTAINGIN